MPVASHASVGIPEVEILRLGWIAEAESETLQKACHETSISIRPTGLVQNVHPLEPKGRLETEVLLPGPDLRVPSMIEGPIQLPLQE
jgi:hypothetical protein